LASAKCTTTRYRRCGDFGTNVNTRYALAERAFDGGAEGFAAFSPLRALREDLEQPGRGFVDGGGGDAVASLWAKAKEIFYFPPLVEEVESLKSRFPASPAKPPSL